MADISGQFQQVLGRAPTQAESDYFNKFISEGNLQPSEISQILQATPEYQKTQLNANTAQYGNTLNAQNEAILGQAGAQAQSRFAGLGRPNSSAMAASVMQAGGQLAQQRQSALASFYGQGLQQNMALGAQQGQDSLGRAYGLQNQKLQRAWQQEDYTRQQNDFNSYQNAHSGWNAITPAFGASMVAGVGGSILGGMAGRAGGLFGGGK